MYLLIFNISILVVVHVLIVETFLVSHVVIQKKRNQLIGQKPTIFLKTSILCLWILMMTQNPQLKYLCRILQTLNCHHIVMIIIILRGVERVPGLVNNLILRYQNQWNNRNHLNNRFVFVFVFFAKMFTRMLLKSLFISCQDGWSCYKYMIS